MCHVLRVMTNSRKSDEVAASSQHVGAAERQNHTWFFYVYISLALRCGVNVHMYEVSVL